MTNKLRCPFCMNRLVNASFMNKKENLYIHLTCDMCYKMVILYRQDYEKVIKNE